MDKWLNKSIIESIIWWFFVLRRMEKGKTAKRENEWQCIRREEGEEEDSSLQRVGNEEARKKVGEERKTVSR